jgi:hypothetical protein
MSVLIPIKIVKLSFSLSLSIEINRGEAHYWKAGVPSLCCDRIPMDAFRVNPLWLGGATYPTVALTDHWSAGAVSAVNSMCNFSSCHSTEEKAEIN